MKVLAAAILVAVGAVVGVAGLLALRDATLSTHQPVVAGSKIEVVVDAATKGGEHDQSLTEMVETYVLLCRLEVMSDVVGHVDVLAPGRYRAVLTPSMDESNRRQFRGCLEDWAIDHVRLDVVRMAPA